MKATRFLPILLAALLLDAADQPAEAACCRASCIGPIPWLACYADTTSCSPLQCAGGASTSLAVDAAATCGQGIFASCPPDEFGACTDAINNDGWIDAVTDAADPDCAVGAPSVVPAVGWLGVIAIVTALIAVAALRIRRRWRH